MHGAIERLLNGPLRSRMDAIGAEIRSRDGVTKAAVAIERVGIAAGAAGGTGTAETGDARR
jgi:hypothetical protein